MFFYYTGHGDFFKNEFYYLLSDFEEKKRRQTSLENSEVDNWIRVLEPELTIKIVDACRSGLSYVKENKIIEQYLEKSKGHFKNCYFMFSSKLDQSSYQDESLSFFTRSFVKSLLNYSSQVIRYKDIIDFISDEFEGMEGQTPFFVVQADFTERFCLINKNIRELASNVSLKINTIESTSDTRVLDNKQLVKIVADDAKNYLKKEEIIELLIKVKEAIKNHKYCPDLLDLYKIESDFDDFYSPTPNLNIIGEWLVQNPNKYFAKVIRNYFHSVGGALRVGFINENNLPIKGFDITASLPYKRIQIISVPKYPNISKCNCTIVFLLSKSTIHFFYFFSTYLETDWNEMTLNKDILWKNIEIQLGNKQEVFNTISKILQEYSMWVFDSIKGKYGPTEDTNSSEE